MDSAELGRVLAWIVVIGAILVVYGLFAWARRRVERDQEASHRLRNDVLAQQKADGRLQNPGKRQRPD